jgi:AcrR family transcriptional regulator
MARFSDGDGNADRLALRERRAHQSAATSDPAAPRESVETRIESAALRCIARRGVRRTTLDDVAHEAGCSRATIYRAFPGGKDAVMSSAAHAEIEHLLAELGAQIERTATLVDALTVAISGATRAVLGHEAFTYLLVNEPGVVRPYLAFDGLDPVLARAVSFLAPHLERHLDPITARRTAEWVARLVVLYAEPGAPFDLTDPGDARQLVAIHVLPGLPANRPQEQVP